MDDKITAAMMGDAKPDLIDRAETIDAIKRLGDGYEPQGYRTALRDAVEAIEQVDAFRAQTEENPPLTLDELRGMDGKPVWVDDFTRPTKGFWGLVSFFRQPKTCKLYVYIYDARQGARNYSSQEYGQCWLAYRRKPEGGGE